jgi:serine/threonine-protein kinase HipA
MPLSAQADQVYTFPRLNPETYHGLPGLLVADSAGNTLRNRSGHYLPPIERNF